jgi:hypothetical protein
MVFGPPTVNLLMTQNALSNSAAVIAATAASAMSVH